MRPSLRHLFRMGMGGILVWTALVAVPPQALADTLPGNAIRTSGGICAGIYGYT